MNIVFFLSQVNGSTATIHVRCHAGGRFVASTGQRIPVRFWNGRKQTVNPSSAELVRIRERLDKLEEELETFMLEPRTKGEFKERVHMLMDMKGSGFMAAYELFLAFKQKSIKNPRVVAKYGSLKKHLIGFEMEEGIELNFAAINEDFAALFYAYFDEQDKSPNYTGRLMKCLKEFMRWSYRKKLHFENGWEQIKSKSVKVPVVVLTGEEIIQLLNTPMIGAVAEVRDSFVIGCLTGIRFGDRPNIRPGHRHGDKLMMGTAKDRDEIMVPICDSCLEILDRNNWRLTSVNLNRYNALIKKAARIAGLTRDARGSLYPKGKKTDHFVPLCDKISSHTARRTFVTMRLAFGDPDQVIMQYTGHNSAKAIDPYRGFINDEMIQGYRLAWGA